MTESQHAGPGGALEIPLKFLEELLTVGPRLASRTRRQVAVVRSLGAHVPCIGRFIAPSEAVRIPAREAPERLTVIDVLTEPEPETTIAPADEAPPAVAPNPTPASDDLPVTDYDSLAASQVVPRLITLNPDELL
ncbi:MAG: hypothetical protein ACKOYM_09420, partial [Actinomycetes bacterium]